VVFFLTSFPVGSYPAAEYLNLIIRFRTSLGQGLIHKRYITLEALEGESHVLFYYEAGATSDAILRQASLYWVHTHRPVSSIGLDSEEFGAKYSSISLSTRR
jgi:hypothetical protein